MDGGALCAAALRQDAGAARRSGPSTAVSSGPGRPRRRWSKRPGARCRATCAPWRCSRAPRRSTARGASTSAATSARRAGLDAAKVQDLHRWRESSAYDDLERDVLDYAEQMSATPVSVDEALRERLRARLGDEGAGRADRLCRAGEPALAVQRRDGRHAAGLEPRLRPAHRRRQDPAWRRRSLAGDPSTVTRARGCPGVGQRAGRYGVRRWRRIARRAALPAGPSR